MHGVSLGHPDLLLTQKGLSGDTLPQRPQPEYTLLHHQRTYICLSSLTMLPWKRNFFKTPLANLRFVKGLQSVNNHSLYVHIRKPIREAQYLEVHIGHMSSRSVLLFWNHSSFPLVVSTLTSLPVPWQPGIHFVSSLQSCRRLYYQSPPSLEPLSSNYIFQQ